VTLWVVARAIVGFSRIVVGCRTAKGHVLPFKIDATGDLLGSRGEASAVQVKGWLQYQMWAFVKIEYPRLLLEVCVPLDQLVLSGRKHQTLRKRCD